MKEHIKLLPTTQVKTDCPRDSKVVSLSIPIFYSPKGIGAHFDKDKHFDSDLFKEIICKGAVWTANSIIQNTDLCSSGMPIYFHVEDVIFESVVDILSEYGVPEDWIRKTHFKDPEHHLDHWLTGKKLYHLFEHDEYDINTQIRLIWDADAFVFRKQSKPFEWYKYFESELQDKMLVSFYSEDNAGDVSYVNWIRRGIGLPEEPTNIVPVDLKRSEIEVYQKAGLPVPDTQHRWGATIFSVPTSHQIIPYLHKHYYESRTDEGLISIYMNSVGCDFVEFDKLFQIPKVDFDDSFNKLNNSCIAHMRGVDTKSVNEYQQKFEDGISGKVKSKGVDVKINLDIDYGVHILSVPHNPSHPDFSHCAFAQKARKLALMCSKHLGRRTHYYGNELSDIPDEAEHVVVTTKDDIKETYGDDWQSSTRVKDFSTNDYLYKMYFLRTEHELRKRVRPGDFICYTFAIHQKPLYYKLQDLKNVCHVESGIGYFNSFMKYRVFESPGLQAYHYGYYGNNSDRYWQLSEEEREKYNYDFNTHFHYSQLPLTDVVIPNSFDVDQFDFRINKDDYFLYIGRINKHKGIEEAMRIANKLGKKLIVAGQGGAELFEKEHGFKAWDNVEFVGEVKPEQRRDLISYALALFCMSRYWEAFGGVHIEAMLSGTPPIGRDHGGYTHTIRSGYNGYRVTLNMYEQGLWAAQNLHRLDPYNIRDFGLRFSNEQIALRYDEYFSSITRMLKNNGNPYWVENPDRDNLDLLDYDRKIDWEEGLMIPVDERT